MAAIDNNSNVLISPKEEECETPPTKTTHSRTSDGPIAANPISIYIPDHHPVDCHDMVDMPTNKGKENPKVSTDETMPETQSATQNSSSKRGRRPKPTPEWIGNWDVDSKKRPHSDRFDKTYRHKEEGFLCRSLLECERYEKHGIRPKHRREMVLYNDKNKEAETEEAIVAKRREEAESMRGIVEEFLAEAHYNQLHMFNNP
ncbi:uncharacterized protein HKW66_Vig0181950 [Vigna angularis]|uniref:Uncharacterized protein n=1 Tax=Phaseolus angularis TaxID=3914 RepID=A0A8T0K411_PHAAN|nr:uncharacterized protein HKW66_Vig0181950 [Vigna angularis]